MCLKYVVLGLLFSSFAGCSRARVEPPATREEPVTLSAPLETRFHHAESGLIADAPRGWGFIEDPEQVEAQCVPVDHKGHLPVILVQVQREDANVTLEQIVQAHSRLISSTVDDVELLADRSVDTDLPNTRAYEITYRGTLEDEAVHTSVVLLRKDQWIVTITGMAARGTFERHVATFQDLTQSLSWAESTQAEPVSR